jgi:hypothetical protein
MTAAGVILVICVTLFWSVLPSFRHIDRICHDRQAGGAAP